MLAIVAEKKSLVEDSVRIISGTGVPTNAVTGAGDCGPASLYFDITNAKMYINGGTKASPTWKLVSSAA